MYKRLILIVLVLLVISGSESYCALGTKPYDKLKVIFVIDDQWTNGNQSYYEENLIKFAEAVKKANIEYELGIVFNGSSSNISNFTNADSFIRTVTYMSFRHEAAYTLRSIETAAKYMRVDEPRTYKAIVVLNSRPPIYDYYFDKYEMDEEDVEGLFDDVIDEAMWNNFRASVVNSYDYFGWNGYPYFVGRTGGFYVDATQSQPDFSGRLISFINSINKKTTVEIVRPENSQYVSIINSTLIPRVTVSNIEGETVTLNAYIDDDNTPYDSRIISNTATSQQVDFDAIDLTSLNSGSHLIRILSDNIGTFVLDEAEFYIDDIAPLIKLCDVSASNNSVSILMEASDEDSGLNDTPYKFRVNENSSGWQSNNTIIFNSLQPNTLYKLNVSVRDKVENTASKQLEIYTKSQIPTVEVKTINTNSIDIKMVDQNPSYTKYQIKVGDKYLNGSGSIQTSETWMTLNQKTASIKGLFPSTNYAVSVRTKSEDGTVAAFSEIQTVTTLSVPPSNISLSPSQTYMELSWNGVAGASGYDVEADGNVYSVNGTSFKHSGLTPDTDHSYRVRSKNSSGAGVWSALYQEKTLPNPPQTPLSIQTIPLQEQITLSWDPVIGATSYQVETDGKTVDVGTSTQYIYKGLQTETTHTLRVKASNRGGESAWSTLQTAETLPYPPDMPSLAMTELSNNHIKLGWNTTARATSYEIEVDGMIISTGLETSYVHTELTPLTSHKYRVRAVNKGGKSTWTEQVEITTHPDAPVTPSNVLASSDETSISLMWYKVAHAESYDIEIDGQIVKGITDTTYVHNGLNADSEHTYRVRALNVTGTSEWSAPLTMFTLPTLDASGGDSGDGDTPKRAPVSLTNVIAIVTNSEIVISWDAVASDVDYQVEVDGDLLDLGRQTTYNHNSLEANTFHRYKIRVKDEDGVSNWCGVLALSTLPDLPDAPQSLIAFADTDSIELRWEKIDGATGYDVEIDGQPVYVGAETSYVHLDLQPGTSHEYRVRAKNITGVTSWSDTFGKTTLNPAYELSVENGADFNLALVASNVQDFSEMTFVVKYDPAQLDLTDSYGFTPNADIQSGGSVEGSDISIKYTPGQLEITTNKPIEPGTSWSGVLSNILFKAKVTGDVRVEFEVK